MLIKAMEKDKKRIFDAGRAEEKIEDAKLISPIVRERICMKMF